ncbi:MAG: hypothetical protein ABI304_09305 [Rudaea sp.]
MLSPMPIVALTCCLMLLAWMCVRRIPEGHAYTFRRVGGHLRTVGAGIHVMWPLIERVAHKIRLLGNEVDVSAHAASGDISGRVYFQVIDAQRADALIDDIAELLRRRIPELTAGTCNDTDPSIRDAHLKAELNRDLRERGVLITRVQLHS